jgi:hypothetical protein
MVIQGDMVILCIAGHGQVYTGELQVSRIEVTYYWDRSIYHV